MGSPVTIHVSTEYADKLAEQINSLEGVEVDFYEHRPKESRYTRRFNVNYFELIPISIAVAIASRPIIGGIRDVIVEYLRHKSVIVAIDHPDGGKLVFKGPIKDALTLEELDERLSEHFAPKDK